MNGQAWSRTDLKYLRELYPLGPTSELSEALGRSVCSVNQTAYKLGLKKSREYLDSDWYEGRLRKGSGVGSQFRFPKGHVPFNKGLRRPGWHAGRMKEMQFKPGERSGAAARNWKPIGTILRDPEGYLRIKVRERGPSDAPGWNREIWPLLSHEVWRKHKGPIPPNHLVRFTDGDRSNCAIENLELISKREHRLRNSMWAMYPPELARTIQLSGVLKRKLREAHGKE